MEDMMKGKLMVPFASYFQDCGIVVQYTTMSSTPEQNGVAKEEQNPYGYGQKYDEYMSLTKITLGRNLETSAYILNRGLSKSIPKTPFEL